MVLKNTEISIILKKWHLYFDLLMQKNNFQAHTRSLHIGIEEHGTQRSKPKETQFTAYVSKKWNKRTEKKIEGENNKKGFMATLPSDKDCPLNVPLMHQNLFNFGFVPYHHFTHHSRTTFKWCFEEKFGNWEQGSRNRGWQRNPVRDQLLIKEGKRSTWCVGICSGLMNSNN